MDGSVVLLSKAEDPDQSVGQPAPSGRRESDKNAVVSPRPTTSQLLLDAEERLKEDLKQASGPISVAGAHSYERNTMKQVLAGPDFRNLEQPTVRDSVLEKIGNWLNRFFESAASLKARSAWVGRVLVWGFTLAVCIALVWGLLRLERRWRIRLTPETDRPGDGAASARDWQLWLEDARKAADAGQWREAIHFVYWASISRLESKRLWPADRARTPREYLALVAADDSRKTGLAQAHRQLRAHAWYGGRTRLRNRLRKSREVVLHADLRRCGSRRECLRSSGGSRAMKFLSSLDPKDRRLLLWSLGIAITLALFIGFVLPNGNGNDNPLPSTYLAGQHGARAAYDSLLRAGYPIERWERPLGELAAIADSHTVVIFAQPFTREREDVKAVSQIIERGGRVLSTGFWGGFLSA